MAAATIVGDDIQIERQRRADVSVLFQQHQWRGPARRADAWTVTEIFMAQLLRAAPASAGTVFRFSTNGTLTTLLSLGGTNGANPQVNWLPAPMAVFMAPLPWPGAESFRHRSSA